MIFYNYIPHEYKNSKQLRNGAVLVVGGGNSGSQIAVELSKDRKTYLSVSHKMKFVPQDIMNKSIFWWLDKLGVYRANVNSMIGQFLKKQARSYFWLRTEITHKKWKSNRKTTNDFNPE